MYVCLCAHRSCADPGVEGGPKKMHMQRKGRFLVVSYEDVVSAAKAAAVAAIVASGRSLAVCVARRRGVRKLGSCRGCQRSNPCVSGRASPSLLRHPHRRACALPCALCAVYSELHGPWAASPLSLLWPPHRRARAFVCPVCFKLHDPYGACPNPWGCMAFCPGLCRWPMRARGPA